MHELSKKELAAHGACLVVGIFFAYLMIPSIIHWIGSITDIEPPKIWKSPLNPKQGVTIVLALMFGSISIALFSHFGRARDGQTSLIPIWPIVLVAGLVAFGIYALTGMFAFGVTTSTLLSFGWESSSAAIVGLVAMVVTLWLLRAK